jgi:hypothetical protein
MAPLDTQLGLLTMRAGPSWGASSRAASEQLLGRFPSACCALPLRVQPAWGVAADGRSAPGPPVLCPYRPACVYLCVYWRVYVRVRVRVWHAARNTWRNPLMLRGKAGQQVGLLHGRRDARQVPCSPSLSPTNTLPACKPAGMAARACRGRNGGFLVFVGFRSFCQLSSASSTSESEMTSRPCRTDRCGCVCLPCVCASLRVRALCILLCLRMRVPRPLFVPPSCRRARSSSCASKRSSAGEAPSEAMRPAMTSCATSARRCASNDVMCHVSE